MATKNVGIWGANGLPFVDREARARIESAGLSNPFAGKKWAVFGDSISQPNTDGLDKYYNYIATNLGMEVTSYAAGGSGYFKGGSSAGYGANNIIDKLTNAPEGYDIISFMAGVNESSKEMGSPTDATPTSEPTTLCGAVRKAIELAIEKYPTAQIFLITPTPGTGNNATPSQKTLNTYANNQMEIAKIYNIPYIDLYHTSGLRPWNADNAAVYYRDYCHLVAAGHQYVAKLMQKWMQNNLVF
jgi:lysophospholipase L1-like esterase